MPTAVAQNQPYVAVAKLRFEARVGKDHAHPPCSQGGAKLTCRSGCARKRFGLGRLGKARQVLAEVVLMIWPRRLSRCPCLLHQCLLSGGLEVLDAGGAGMVTQGHDDG